MCNHTIYEQTVKVQKKYDTRNPFQLLQAMKADVRESYQYSRLKGYCYYANRSTFVVINGLLDDAEKTIVAAHEAAHLILHHRQIMSAPMRDLFLYDMTSKLEYEANLFAADFLIEDERVLSLIDDEEMDFFSLCKTLYLTPEFLSFKLYSLIQRGFRCTMPLTLDSRFLKKGDV